jgi:chemotaxis methyl-accepting protein methylase
MSLILPKNKKWQQINGQIKIEIENSIFHECSKDWIQISTLIPFPLEENEELEKLIISFVEYDLNARKIQKTKVVACRNVCISQDK